MKKVLFGVLLLVVMLGLLCGCKEDQTKQETKVGKFSLSDYQQELEEFPQNIPVDPFEDAAGAIKCAKSIWDDFYDCDDDVKICEVYYDSANNAWLVCGTIPDKDMVGGVPYVIVDATENIAIAVWHEK